jgi:glycosyltransferase involved in cell wall biosynthesis
LPDAARRHRLVASEHVLYRAKSRRPDVWLAALDVFLYAARFEEFGIVVAEALAAGVPVLTSRRVVAAECLPPAYSRWLIDRPDSAELARNALELLDDEHARHALSSAGLECVAALDQARYVRATLDLVLDQNR